MCSVIRVSWLCHVYNAVTHVTWRIYVWYDAFACDMTRSQVTRHIHVSHSGDKTHPFDKFICIWHYSFICVMTYSYVTWLIHTWHDSSICDMTHSYVAWLIHMWHDSFICDMTHSYVTWLIHMWHDSFICNMTHSYVTWLQKKIWRDSKKITFRYSHVQSC